MNKQLINAVSQSSYKYAETSELDFFHGYTCVHVYNTQIFWQTCDSNKSIKIWQKVILRQIFVQIHFKQGREIQNFIVGGREFQRDWDCLRKSVCMLVVFSVYWNKSSKVLYFLLCVHLFESNSCVTTGHYCGICDMLKWNFSVEILASDCLCWLAVPEVFINAQRLSCCQSLFLFRRMAH